MSKTLTNLTASAVSADDLFYIVTGGNSRKVTAADIATFIAADTEAIEALAAAAAAAADAAAASAALAATYALGEIIAIRTITASDSVVTADARKLIVSTAASAIDLTIDPEGTTAFTTLERFHVLQKGAGQVTLVAGVGVTIHTPDTLKLQKQNSIVSLIKIGSDEWVMLGQLEA